MIKWLSLALLCVLLTGCQWFGGDGAVRWRNGVPVKTALLDDNDHNRAYKYGAAMPAVKYITIHNTANSAPAINERTYLNNRSDKTYISYHYAVDENEALQILPHNRGGWHAGDGKGSGNTASIGIEICRSTCYGDDAELYRRAEENAARLAASLLDEFGLPTSALRKHQDWSGKKCPHRILAEGRWEAFKVRVDALRRR